MSDPCEEAKHQDAFITDAIIAMGSAIHETYLTNNSYIRIDAPHLAVPFKDLPWEEQQKDLDIALIYYTDKTQFVETLAEQTHTKWLEGYRAQHGDKERIRNGIRIDLPWVALPEEKQEADMKLAAEYMEVFAPIEERLQTQVVDASDAVIAAHLMTCYHTACLTPFSV